MSIIEGDAISFKCTSGGTGWKVMQVIEDGSVAYIGVLEKE